MSVTSEIWSTLANATGLTFTEVSEIGRRIREKGLFSKHTKARSSQVITDHDLANLTIAVMGGLPSRQAHVAVERMMEARQHTGDGADNLAELICALGDHGAPLEVLQRRGHTFTEALAALYAAARRSPEVFRSVFKDSIFSINQKSFGARIHLHTPPNAIVARSFYSKLDYEQPNELFSGDLSVIAMLSGPTLAAVASVADRVTP